jgi:uncharacterized protein (DUF934 family)
MAGDKNLKKRPKATPSRIQHSISNQRLIEQQSVVDNDMVHIAETPDLSLSDLPTGNISVPLNLWLEYKDQLRAREVAVQVAADEDPSDLEQDLNSLKTIVLPFVNHTDGRSYSLAFRLRTQLGFKGEIRAVGDVHFDHLDFLQRVGINAFELPDDEDHQAALQAFQEFSEVYQPSADGHKLVFSRRRVTH